MTESVIDIRDRLRSRRPRRPAVRPAVVTDPSEVLDLPPAFAVENAESGRTVISTPLDAEVAAAPQQDDFLLRLSGRLVEAERANRNGAFWTQGDLEFGLPSVAYGPLNWLHQETKIVGTLLSPELVGRDREAAGRIGPHIRTDALVWEWLYPREAAMVREYAGAGRAWLSMECISQRVQCVGPNGCGREFAYLDYQRKHACSHLNERASHRRFVNPIFQGAAVIVPPVSPGWANADLRPVAAVERQAAGLLESAAVDVAGVEAEVAHSLLAQILQWSARP